MTTTTFQTTKLNSYGGNLTVLAKPDGDAYTFSNLTQANRRAAEVAAAGADVFVAGRRPFYVAFAA